jgi:hypothetical protein
MSDSARGSGTRDAIAAKPASETLTTEPALPVVARLIVEIRSDGSRTVARGAMEDAASGTRAVIEASGTTPLELALKLAKSIARVPWFSRTLARGALRGLLRKP